MQKNRTYCQRPLPLDHLFGSRHLLSQIFRKVSTIHWMFYKMQCLLSMRTSKSTVLTLTASNLCDKTNCCKWQIDTFLVNGIFEPSTSVLPLVFGLTSECTFFMLGPSSFLEIFCRNFVQFSWICNCLQYATDLWNKIERKWSYYFFK